MIRQVGGGGDGNIGKTPKPEKNHIAYVEEQKRNREALKKERTTIDKELEKSVFIDRYGIPIGRGINFGTKDIVKTIKEAAKRYNEATSQIFPVYGIVGGHKLNVGDLSLKGGLPSDDHIVGGVIYDHKGFSVDVLPGTKDGSKCGKYSEDEQYSVTNTIKMISIISEVAAEHNLELDYVIFADSNVYNSDELTNINFYTSDNLLANHESHIHFEFKAIF